MASLPHALTEFSSFMPAMDVPCKRRRSFQSQGRVAFTLVEIMIVVVIIGLLAALAIPAFQRVQQRSRAARMANDFRQFDSAFQRYALENGSLPGPTGMGLIPTGMSGYLPEAYTKVSPVGGQYLWTGPSQYIVLRSTQATDGVMQLVDAALDDGVLTTGNFRKIGANNYGLWVR